MTAEVKLLALVLGGVAFAACGGSSTTEGAFGGQDAGGTSSSSGAGTSSGTTSSSGASSGISSSSSGSSSGSSSSGSSSGATSSSSGSSSGPAGYAIPLSAPEGIDEEYCAQVTVGDQTFAMQIDTGSTSAAVAGSACTSCTKVSPLYTASSTATATGKTGESSYADGSGWSGPVYTDTVGLGNGSPTVSLEVVDISKSTGQFFSGDNDYQGILGLGPSQNAVPNTDGYIPQLLAGGVASVLAFELCDVNGDNAGTMWLGGDGAPSGTVTYTPLVPITDDNPYYAINVDAMGLDGTSFVTNASATFAQPVLDTGTSLFYVPTSVFNSFQTALEASAGFKTVFGTSTFTTDKDGDVCVTATNATDAQVESTLPALSLSLPNVTTGSADVTIQASALDTYFYANGGGSYCLAIGDGGTQDASTFGDAFLQAFHVIVDITGGRIGFATTGCVAPQIRRVLRRPANKGPHRPPRPLRH